MKRLFILLACLFCLVLLYGESTSYAFNTQDIIDMLDYLHETNQLNTGGQYWYELKESNPTKFNEMAAFDSTAGLQKGLMLSVNNITTTSRRYQVGYITSNGTGECYFYSTNMIALKGSSVTRRWTYNVTQNTWSSVSQETGTATADNKNNTIVVFASSMTEEVATRIFTDNNLCGYWRYSEVNPLLEQTSNGNYLNCFKIRKNTFQQIADISFRTYIMNNQVKEYTDINYKKTLYSGDTYIVSLDKEDIQNGQQIYIDMFWKGQRTNTSTNPAIINMTNNGNTGQNQSINQYNPSGEITGSIDITPIINGINNINETQQETNQLIESGNTQIIGKLEEIQSGDETRFDFWKSIYNGLFTLESGDIEDLKDKLSNNFEIEDANMYKIIKQFHEYWTDATPGDFKIKWDPVYYENQIIIPSGDINFTQKAEEIPILHRVHNILQTVLSFAAFLLVARGWLKMCFVAAGIGAEFMETGEQENEITETVHDTVDYDTGVVTRTVNYTLPSGNSLSTIKRAKRKI